MASGCILGDCPLCGFGIYEDEAGFDDDLALCHESCLKEKILWRSVHDHVVLIAVRKKKWGERPAER